MEYDLDWNVMVQVCGILNLLLLKVQNFTCSPNVLDNGIPRCFPPPN